MESRQCSFLNKLLKSFLLFRELLRINFLCRGRGRLGLVSFYFLMILSAFCHVKIVMNKKVRVRAVFKFSV